MTRRVIGGVAIAVVMSCVAAARAGERVIPPDAGKTLFPALQHGAPGWALASARIERDAVWASLCEGGDPARCFSVRLTDPRGGCATTTAGAWCVSFPDGAPPSPARAPLVAALAALREADMWIEPAAAPPAPSPSSARAPDPPPRVRHPWALACGLIAAPIALGFVVGRALRPAIDRFARRGAIVAALALLPVVIVLLAMPVFRRVGAWDLIALALLAGVALAAGTAKLAGRALLARVVVAMVATLAALGVLELATRALPAPAASFPPPEEARFFFAAAPGLDTCAPLFPAEDPSIFATRTAGLREGAPKVLHLGDSMVEGVGVTPDRAFPALLGRAQPPIDHVNAGFASTSLDFQLSVARAWLDRLNATRVVLYVFGYNDLSELDREHPCCPGGPLLDAAARPRCATPGLPSGRLDLLAASPAPYAVRIATARSALARRMAAGFASASAALASRRVSASGEARFARYATLLTALRDELRARDVRLTVVYLPARSALEDAKPEATGDRALGRRVSTLCQQLGVEVIDPWDMLLAAVQKDGAAKWFLPPPDVHFTVEGHRLMADWLAQRLSVGP